jgi:hypothetical protein
LFPQSFVKLLQPFYLQIRKNVILFFEDNEGSILTDKVSANAVSLSYRRTMRALFFTLKNEQKKEVFKP